jgi:membrane fusion protein
MFRTVALQSAATDRQCGDVVLQHSMSTTALVAMFGAIAIGVVAFFCTFGVTRKAQVTGMLLPAQGAIRVTSQQQGVVIQRRVQEGSHVRQGDVLFVLSADRASASRGDTAVAVSVLLEQRLASLQVDQTQLHTQSMRRAEAARRRIDDLEADRRRILDQLRLQRRRVALGVEALARYTDLELRSFVSPANVQQHQSELIDQQQRLAEFERGRATNERDIRTAQSELRDLETQGQRDYQAASRGIASVEQDLAENEARKALEVRASQGGVVTALTADLGQAVGVNQILATILPEGSELEAELYAPSRSAGFIKVGMPVLLRYQAYPYQKFGQHEGRIKEVSAAALSPVDMSVSMKTTEPMYRVRVKLGRQEVLTYGTAQRLRSGMTLDASVLLETRKLYEWVLDPLFGITGRL